MFSLIAKDVQAYERMDACALVGAVCTKTVHSGQISVHLGHP